MRFFAVILKLEGFLWGVYSPLHRLADSCNSGSLVSYQTLSIVQGFLIEIHLRF